MIERDYEFWQKEIKRSVKSWKDFHEKSKELQEMYNSSKNKGEEKGKDTKSFNILYSNTEIQRGALKVVSPNPIIKQRFSSKDDKFKNNLCNEASEIIERAIQFEIETNNTDILFNDVIKDALICGLGLTWKKYFAEIEEDEDGNPLEIKKQNFLIEYVNPLDFITGDGRKDSEVQWIARRHLLLKEQAKEYFPEHYDLLHYKYSLYGEAEQDKYSDKENKDSMLACVWEIWDKIEKTRIYFSDGIDELISKEEDPYKLKDFFPCDKLSFIENSQGIIPVSEYSIYERLANRLNGVIERKFNLIKKAKINGLVTSKGANSFSKLEDLPDGSFATADIENLDGQVWTPDLSKIEVMISRLSQEEENIKADIYEITGVSDILRGYNDPMATATSEIIKSKFGSLRIVLKKQEVQIFIRDNYLKLGELICEHGSIEYLKDVSGLSIPTEIEALQMRIMNNSQEQIITWETIREFIKDDKLRNYNISIETSATAFDDIEEQNAAIDNLFNSFTSMITQATQVIMQAPELIEPYKEMILAKIRLSNIGRSLENSVIIALDKIKEKIEISNSQPDTPPQPDPNKVAELQAKQQIEMQKIQIKDSEGQQKNALLSREITRKEKKDIVDYNLKQQELNAEIEFNQIRANQGLAPSGNLGI